LLNVAFEGGDHRERDESMKDLADKGLKRHGVAEAKEKPNSLCITCSALRLDFAFSTSLLEIYTPKVSPKCWKRTNNTYFGILTHKAVVHAQGAILWDRSFQNKKPCMRGRDIPQKATQQLLDPSCHNDDRMDPSEMFPNLKPSTSRARTT
jgi:hypothetical protein